jgi:PAS domain S-box-containing protein
LNNYILIDKENIITDLSEEFCRMFSLNAEELKGRNINDRILGIPVILRTIINDFIESKNKSYTS